MAYDAMARLLVPKPGQPMQSGGGREEGRSSAMAGGLREAYVANTGQ